MLLGLASADNAAGESPHASRCGVEVRLPYRDRRLVEFALALPAQQLFCGGRYKVIARNAMSGLLPERVRMRTHPTVLTPLMRRGLCERESEIVDRLLRRDGTLIRRLLRDEWLDRAASRSLRTDTEELVRWLCVAVELWHTDSTRDSGRTGEAGRFEF
jgi:asparagine synthase (glutamine-hydrolysing)